MINTTDLLVAVIAAISGGGITYVTAVQKNKNDKNLAILKAEDDKELEVQKANLLKDSEIQKTILTKEIKLQKHKQTLMEEMRRKILELRGVYDLDVRKNRITAYQSLWKILSDVGFFSAQDKLNSDGAIKSIEKLIDWYYQVGGLYMTEESYNKFRLLLDNLQLMIDNILHKDCDKDLPQDVQDKLKKFGEDLRQSLVEDVGTRERAMIEGIDDNHKKSAN